MVSAEGTILTDRQLTVLERREAGEKQAAIATDIDTTVANVSAIETAARENVEKAKQTVELVRTLRASIHFTVSAGATFEELIDAIYTKGDRVEIVINHNRPQLQSNLFERLENFAKGDRLAVPVKVGIEGDGAVKVYPVRSIEKDS